MAISIITVTGANRIQGDFMQTRARIRARKVRFRMYTLRGQRVRLLQDPELEEADFSVGQRAVAEDSCLVCVRGDLNYL
jgi:hypothetical protein